MRYLYIVVLLAGFSAFAQEHLETDRPGQSNTPSVVPLGKFQAEAGVRHTQAGQEHLQWQLPGVLLKYGVSEHFELRANAQIADNIAPDSINAGLKPLMMGVKVKLTEEKGWMPQASLLAQVQLPKVASTPFAIENVAPEIVVALKNTVGGKGEIQYNLGMAWDGETPEPSYLYTLQPSFEISRRLNAFVESYAYFPQHGHPDHWIDCGLMLLLTDTVQLDISGGYELSARNHYHSFFETIGFSFRI